MLIMIIGTLNHVKMIKHNLRLAMKEKQMHLNNITLSILIIHNM